MAELIADWRDLDNALNTALSGVAIGLDQALDAAIESPIWAWPRETQRANGETVGSPRNIVDQGELLRSKRFTQGTNSADWEWTAEHALFVHEGVTLRNGTELPARRWTEFAVNAYNPQAKFAIALREAL